jgi:hypothetical protein
MSGVTGDNPYRASGVVDALAAGRTGTVNWQTGSIKTATFTATSSEGYFVNTTGGAITVNLPAGTAGDIVGLKDYAGTWDSNAVTLNPDGSDLIGGASAVDPTLESEGGAVLLVYVDGTQGWLTTQESVTASPSGLPLFTAATGGTPCAGATCGDYKIHTFTGPGTLCVSAAGTPAGSDTVEYLVVAGGGSGSTGDGTHGGGGGGGGGFRFASPSIAPLTYPAKPLAAPANLPVTVQGYSITVGAGGTGVEGPPAYSNTGADAVFSTITSTGGGGGGFFSCTPSQQSAGKPGGSGGGGGTCSAAGNGSGNTPPVSPPQGNDGGTSPPVGGYSSGGGGGGAIAVGTQGTQGPGSSRGGPGGAGGGFPSAFGTSGQECGGVYYFSGGAGAGPRSCATTPTPTGGLGGGGTGVACNGTAGTTNTGGGGGSGSGNAAGSNGGSGIVIIRYKFQ